MWQTRTLAGFIAATVPTQEGEDNPLLALAESIGRSGEDPVEPVATEAAQPAPGTFEAFLGSFATPTRWAGRD